MICTAPTRASRGPVAPLLALAILATSLTISSPARADDNDPSDELISVEAPVFVDPLLSPSRPALTPGEIDELGGHPAVIEYWTDERLDSAIPRDLHAPQDPGTSPGLVPSPTTLDPEVITGPAEPLGALEHPEERAVTNWSRTNGKVFFRDPADGKNYMCSGSAVNSTSKRLVSTAGHCVYGSRGWFQNWIFVPNYQRGARPHGTFQASSLTTFTEYTTNLAPSWKGFNSDVAFATTRHNANGQRVVNAVGGHGLVTGGADYTFSATIFGYPGNLQSGETMYVCSRDRSEKYAAGGFTFSRVSGCGMGGGASGGPWLRNYSNATGLGNIKSITSFTQDGTRHLGAPFFRQGVRTLYAHADSLG